MKRDFDVVIVGGGVAGLVCARKLHAEGLSCRLFEAADQVGGRIRTDDVDGFLLDRGFQVFLTAYPEAKSLLDYEKLQLCEFEPGALIWFDGKFHRLSDPWRRPQHLWSTLVSPAATLLDKVRIAAFRRQSKFGDLDSIYKRTERPTIELLQQQGFSDRVINRFLRPFLGGVFLDRDLATSSRMCQFVFRMFATGRTTVPKYGMRSIPQQLAAGLPPEMICTNSPVMDLGENELLLKSGQRITAKAIVVATEAPNAHQLLGEPQVGAGRSVECLYFAADEPPIREPILVLNGEAEGPINNLCVLSQVSSAYAPAGQSLISVSVLNEPDGSTSLLKQTVGQLKQWFGSAATSWRHLRTYHIQYALPAIPPPALDPVAKSPIVRPGVFWCGDHCDTASINGAMSSGRRAGEAVLAHLAGEEIHGAED